MSRGLGVEGRVEVDDVDALVRDVAAEDAEVVSVVEDVVFIRVNDSVFAHAFAISVSESAGALAAEEGIFRARPWPNVERDKNPKKRRRLAFERYKLDRTFTPSPCNLPHGSASPPTEPLEEGGLNRK